MKFVFISVISFGLMFLVSGCELSGEKEENLTQVAAKVNGSEVTINQVNQALNSLKLEKNVSTDDVKNKVLGKVIEQELLVQEALKLQLDRNPKILSQIEQAKRDVLIKAYFQRMLPSQEDVTDADIRKYYIENEDIFANRMTYKYRQLIVRVEGVKKEELVAFLKESEDFDEIKNFIDREKFPARLSNDQKSSEKIPKQMRGAFSKLNVGDIGYASLGDGVLIFLLQEKQSAAIDLNESRQIISRLLTTENRSESSQELIEALWQKSQVEYFNGFSGVSE